MPPKKGKKKGKKGKKGKGKKEKDPNEITEVERELFTIQITDLTAKVERLKSRCLELESLNFDQEKSMQQLDEDRSDVIAYLKNDADQKQEEIEELEERIQGLIRSRETEVTMYREKIVQNNHDFKVMHEQLTSEIKLLSGKLNSLEEFKLQRDELLRKFKKQEDSMSLQEGRHKDVLYEVERKFIIGKDKLKKEMEGRLLQLSTDFADATEIRIAATTHHAIRENIAINNELDLMLTTYRKLKAENEHIRQHDTQLKQKLQLCEQEKHAVLSKNATQLKLLNRLADEHQSMEIQVSALENEVQRSSDFESRLLQTEAALAQSEFDIRIEKQKLHGALYEQQQLRYQTDEAKLKAEKLMAVINACVNSIQEVLSTKDQDEAYMRTRRENLLPRLLQLMDSSTIQYIEVPTMQKGKKTVVYEQGDLGLVKKTSQDSQSKGSAESESHASATSNVSPERQTSAIEDEGMDEGMDEGTDEGMDESPDASVDELSILVEEDAVDDDNKDDAEGKAKADDEDDAKSEGNAASEARQSVAE